MAHDADVLIVGLGPVGAVLAGLLAQRGVSVIAVEREREIYRLPRAAHFDHEIMRIFQQLGIAETVAADARVVQAYEFHNAAGDVLVRFDLRGRLAVSGWPASYLFHQPTMEQALREVLAAAPNVALHAGCRLLRIERNDLSGVTAVVADANGSERRIAARFLIGADGGSSAVRQSLGVGLTDYGFEKPFLVVDTVVRDESGLPQAALQICDPQRPTTVMPMSPGRRRWEFMLMDGETAKEMLTDERVAALLAGQVDLARIEIVRKAVYVFHGLVAERWHVGSVLLAGDAAHQMPPFMGQGMCSGLRDAANLAWKLAMVLDGSAPAALLDSYQAEREPHVRAVIRMAIELGQMVCINDSQAAAGRDADMMARRAAHGDPPETPPLPDLSGGLLTNTAHAGALFPQMAAHAPGGASGKLDDVLGGSFWLITSGPPPAHVPPFVRLVQAGGDIDSGGVLEAWLRDAGAEAVLVRPDRIVFGTGDANDLLAKLKAGFTVNS